MDIAPYLQRFECRRQRRRCPLQGVETAVASNWSPPPPSELPMLYPPHSLAHILLCQLGGDGFAADRRAVGPRRGRGYMRRRREYEGKHSTVHNPWLALVGWQVSPARTKIRTSIEGGTQLHFAHSLAQEAGSAQELLCLESPLPSKCALSELPTWLAEACGWAHMYICIYNKKKARWPCLCCCCCCCCYRYTYFP